MIRKDRQVMPKDKFIVREKKSPSKLVPIVKHVAEVSQDLDRKYDFEYVTGDGMTRKETGYLKNPESENPIQVVRGSYSYTGRDGKVYTVEYIADEKGFRPIGGHLPAALQG